MNLTLITVIILLLALQLKEREIKESRLWILPLLILYYTLNYIFHSNNLTFQQILWCVFFFVVGGVVGVIRGKLTEVRYYPGTGQVTAKSSWLGTTVWFGLFALRLILYFFIHDGEPYTLILLTDIFLSVACGNIIARRIVLFLKIRNVREGIQ